MEDKEQSVEIEGDEIPKGKKEKTELPEGYEWRNGCKSCVNYKALQERDFYLPLNFQTNLPDPTGKGAVEKIRDGEKIDFWVRHNKTGRTEVVDRKWYEENRKRLDMEHIKMTSCRFKRIYKHKVVDETTGKVFEKEYCAYWHKE